MITMNKPVGFALLGCGSIAQKYCSAIAKHLDNGTLVAVCDLDASKAQSLGQKYNVPWFADADSMLEQVGDRIDLINILTPSGYHCKNVLDLVSYGKHLCVEKPMALTLEDADAMISACEEKGIHLFVVNQNRFNVPIQKLQQAIEQGRLGKIVMASVRLRWSRSQEYYDRDNWRGTWALDGGVFANQAYHFIDLLQWLVGDIQSLTAKGATRLAKIETEDTGVALLKFDNGALGTVEATTAVIPASQECSLTILGELGTVEIAGFSANEMRIWQFAQPQPEDAEILANGCKNPAEIPAFGHVSYLRSAIATLQEGKPPIVDGRAGRKSLQAISAIYESMTTGREVNLNRRYHTSLLGRQNQNFKLPEMVVPY